VARSKSLKESAKKRIPKCIKKKVAEKMNRQTGSGTSKSKHRDRDRILVPRRRHNPVRVRRYNDIFAHEQSCKCLLS